MTKLKSKITIKLKHLEETLEELDKTKDTHPHDGPYMLGQVNTFNSGMGTAMSTVNLLREAVEAFNDCKEDILSLAIGAEYKYELTESPLR